MHNLHEGIILNPLPFQFCMGNFSNQSGVCNQEIRINIPIELYLTGEMSHRIRFNACAGDAQFLALNQHRPGATKWVQYALLMCDAKSFKVGADKMWRK